MKYYAMSPSTLERAAQNNPVLTQVGATIASQMAAQAPGVAMQLLASAPQRGVARAQAKVAKAAAKSQLAELKLQEKALAAETAEIHRQDQLRAAAADKEMKATKSRRKTAKAAKSDTPVGEVTSEFLRPGTDAETMDQLVQMSQGASAGGLFQLPDGTVVFAQPTAEDGMYGDVVTEQMLAQQLGVPAHALVQAGPSVAAASHRSAPAAAHRGSSPLR